MPYCYLKGQICSGLLSFIFTIGEIDVCAMCILLKVMEPNAIALICLHMFHSICTFLYSTWTSLILHPMSCLPWSARFQSRSSGICCILLTVLQQKFTRDLLQLLRHYFPVHQLKCETDCIAAAVVVSLCAKGPQLLGTAHQKVHVC